MSGRRWKWDVGGPLLRWVHVGRAVTGDGKPWTPEQLAAVKHYFRRMHRAEQRAQRAQRCRPR